MRTGQPGCGYAQVTFTCPGDLIKQDAVGKITEFKVMRRPLKAINLIHERMGAMLKALQAQQ